MLSRLAQKPNANKAPNNATGEPATPRPTRASAYKAADKITTRLLPSRSTNQAAKGSDTQKPTGKANNTVPIEASLRASDALMVGMRDAQLAKHNPCIKK